MKPSGSAAVILVTMAFRPSRPRRWRAASRSMSLDRLAPSRNWLGMRSADSHADQWRRPLSCGAARVRKAIDGRRDRPLFHFAGRRKRSKLIRNKTQRVATACYKNASKCSETFRNALLRMTYCLGHPAIAASNGPVGNQHPFCKSMQSSA